jgi:hypothetical protein
MRKPLGCVRNWPQFSAWKAAIAESRARQLATVELQCRGNRTAAPIGSPPLNRYFARAGDGNRARMTSLEE